MATFAASAFLLICAPSRRGDLEVLGYCLLRWLCGELPWEQNLKDPGAVQAAKTKLLDELPNSVLTLASGKSTTREVAEYLTCVYKLSYDEKPNYDVLKRILSGGLDSPCANVKGLQNISAAAGYSPVDFQVGCQKANPEPVKLRVQNKTCEKKVKAASAGMKYHKTQEYDPAFTNEVRCRSETSGTKVVLQKPPSKPVLKCFQKKTCEEVAKVTENGYCIKCQVADENEELFVRETYYNKEIPRAKVCTKSEASYQCLRTTFTEAEDMASKEDRDGNRSAYMFEHQQPNAKDGLFEGSANPRILQPRFSATAKAQMMAIVLVLLITFLLLYSDNVQVLLRRQLL